VLEALFAAGEGKR